MSIIVNKNTPILIDANTIGNNSSDGKWKIISTHLTHDNNLASYIDKEIPELIEGDTYKVTYIVTGFSLCSVRVALGSNEGTNHSANGTYIEVFVHSGLNKIRFWSNGIASISYYKIEHLVTTISQTPVVLDERFENKSWTLSYNPILQQWISFHSYLPNNYIIHSTGLLTKRNDTQIQLINSGDYGKFFDEDIKPWIVETVFNDNKLYTKVFDNITVNLESNTSTEVATNKFFDNIVLYNEFQSTGLITLDSSNLTKKEKNWTINKFTDLTNNNVEPLFNKDWTNISSEFPIDKVVNTNKIDNSKAWYLRARMRDKYLVVRFIENNVDNNQITLKFVLSIYRESVR